MVSFHVVVVCAANVCRSPAAAVVLRAGLADRPGRSPGVSLAGAVTVADAGIAARPGAGACVRAQRWVAGVPGAVTGVPHEARQLDIADIARADLLLALDHDVRAAVLGRGVGQVPDLRRRVFTLTEAAALATGVAEAVSRGVAPARRVERARRVGGLRLGPVPADVEERLRWLVAEMDAARGLVRVRARRRLTGSTNALDIPDAHALGTSHRRMLPAMAEAVGELVAALRQVSEAAETGPTGPKGLSAPPGRRIKR